MKTSTAVALLLSLAVASCGAQKSTPTTGSTTKFAILAKSSPGGTPSDCDAIDGKTCVINVAVSVSGDTCTVTMKDYVKLGDTADINRIEWRLQSGYRFCSRAGDGVFYDSPAAADDDQFDIDLHGPCKAADGWKRKNKNDKDYAYVMRFRDDANTLMCVKDPWFKNG
jgi:hypothetical protein